MKEEERGGKRTTKIILKTINKMAIKTYLSIITLNVNGLNAPVKKHKVTEWIKKTRPIYTLPMRDTFQI